jgi:putative glutathione S-transferase
LTAADVDLWVTLVQLDVVHRLHLDADVMRVISGHDNLWSYVRRLHDHPAFHRNFHADDMARLHRLTCRDPESSGAAVTLPRVLRTSAA